MRNTPAVSRMGLKSFHNHGLIETLIILFLDPLFEIKEFSQKTGLLYFGALLFGLFKLSENEWKHTIPRRKSVSYYLVFVCQISLQVIGIYLSIGNSKNFHSICFLVAFMILIPLKFQRLFSFCDALLLVKVLHDFAIKYFYDSAGSDMIESLSYTLVFIAITTITLHSIAHTVLKVENDLLSMFIFFFANVMFILNEINFNITPIIETLFKEDYSIAMVIFWLVSIVIGIPAIDIIRESLKVSNIIVRKYYHFLAFAMFTVGIYFTPKLMKLAFGVAIYLFMVLEYNRQRLRHESGFDSFNDFLKKFIDDRDSDDLIITHIYLLIGCAYPFMMDQNGLFRDFDNYIVKISGCLVLGIGDSFAAIIGKKFGKKRIPFFSKSFEGTLAFICSQLIVISILQLAMISTAHFSFFQLAEKYLFSISVMGILEFLTYQNDNILLPLWFHQLLRARITHSNVYQEIRKIL